MFRKRLLLGFGLLAFATVAGPPAAHAATVNPNPFCARIGKTLEASSGAQMYCFGPQISGTRPHARIVFAPFGANVDAANPSEDVSPAGVQADGQSETSIAAIGPYVVEAWNDATQFISPCPSPGFKEEGTGLGFSANGGVSFVDEGGLPNVTCKEDKYFGDPSVEAWAPGGSAHFYISSLFDKPSLTGVSFLALSACGASGSGTTARLSCGQPVIIAESTQCIVVKGALMCSFLDKDFIAIDPVRGRLYVAYTEFGFTDSGVIKLAVCDIGTPTGGVGPAGGRASAPVCNPGPHPTTNFKVAGSVNCENEGAYPAVDLATGNVYVGWESNWATDFMTPACFNTPTLNQLAAVPLKCLPLTGTSPCSAPGKLTAVQVVSTDATFIPGYNRFPSNDFPRLAVSDRFRTVSIVWNDAKAHPLGDIYLKSFNLGTLTPVQAVPVRINSLANGGLHFLPALRNVDANGNLNISFYQRAVVSTTFTDLVAALNVNPLTASTPPNVRETTVASDWLTVSSLIIPNFGDYTDNYVQASSSPPFTTTRTYAAWSDGRIGIPQPFETVMKL